ncbi:MAG TPA: hypothetical protein VNW52_05865 [Burkholderiaceae bacterium]|jgi:hypothetical protein|nr:hypothetical protein [Burkholderiaceae bacterium]
MRTNEQKKIYFRELGGSMVIYAAILASTLSYGPAITSEPWRTLVMISPMIGFCLMLWAIARQVSRSDEFMRKNQVENFAIAAAVTAGLSVTYGFLENAGYPRLSMFLVSGVMGMAWPLVAILRGNFASCFGKTADE